MAKALDVPMLLSESGGCYATQLGIRLDDLKAEEIYKWLLAAILYGARISENIATRTWQVFEHEAVLTPESIIRTGWDGLVALLDQGSYTRYDYKTATKLLAVSQTLLDRYAGNLNCLHAAARDSDDLAQRVMSLGKGIGPVTAQIFLRELRGRWSKAAPPLAALAFQAAQALGFLSQNCHDSDQALINLQKLWDKQRIPMASFPDFEAALIRYGLRLRRQRKKVRSEI
ncbi:hypothetical protein [Nitrosomonas sp. Nm166]|uniref:hypothetical protein n=1 Tax=Nitrosomonas sp. Nm166 TaxID=1881054 RepID=UPI0008E66AB6|nr:hypothetical protein [Nitrosomonas sp. Nm166]SFF09689.1 hypothetical protein SAMN05428977_104924 [Nitrosomonas sp. Nm166]